MIIYDYIWYMIYDMWYKYVIYDKYISMDMNRFGLLWTSRRALIPHPVLDGRQDVAADGSIAVEQRVLCLGFFRENPWTLDLAIGNI